MTDEFDSIIPLTFNCIFDTTVDDCPFTKIRELVLKKRLLKINKMEQKEKMELFNTHFQCYINRLGKKGCK